MKKIKRGSNYKSVLVLALIKTQPAGNEYQQATYMT